MRVTSRDPSDAVATFRVRALDGTRAKAVLGDDMDPALAEDCLRTGRVIACDRAGPHHRRRAPDAPGGRDRRGRGARGAREGHPAPRRQHARNREKPPGPFTLRVNKAGVARLEGDRLVIDMSELVRLLAARVELP